MFCIYLYIIPFYIVLWGFPGVAVVKSQLPMQETQEKRGFDPWVRKV